MCQSFEISFLAALFVFLVVLILLQRRTTKRDVWNAIFIGIFGTMQVVDMVLWYLEPQPTSYNCSRENRLLTEWGFRVIVAEPIGALIGLMVASNNFRFLDLTIYILLFAVLPFYWFCQSQCPHVQNNCMKWMSSEQIRTSCTLVTRHHHLMYGLASDDHGGICCWPEYPIQSASHQTEIPIMIRVLYLLGMLYPYSYMQPYLSAIVVSSILTATWFIGYLSDAHASMWCVAAVLVGLWALIDPYVLPPDKLDAFAEPPQSNEAQATRSKLYESRFSPSKIPTNIDAIIIGSGIGGLATAASLARLGKRVLVLEDHYRIGGCTHTFKESCAADKLYPPASSSSSQLSSSTAKNNHVDVNSNAPNNSVNHGEKADFTRPEYGGTGGCVGGSIMGTDSSRLCPPSSLQFDSGVHYVGARSILAFLLSWITQSPIHFAPLGRSENCFAYDIIDMDGVRVTYRGAGGRQGIEKELCEKFPHESAGIRSYLQESGERAGTGSASLLLLKLLPRAAVSSAKESVWERCLWSPLRDTLHSSLHTATQETAAEAVARHISDPLLRSMLTGGQLIDWNLTPNRCSAWVPAAMSCYYEDGGFYPEGGARVFAENLVPVIESAGGAVLTRARVASVLTSESLTRERDRECLLLPPEAIDRSITGQADLKLFALLAELELLSPVLETEVENIAEAVSPQDHFKMNRKLHFADKENSWDGSSSARSPNPPPSQPLRSLSDRSPRSRLRLAGVGLSPQPSVDPSHTFTDVSTTPTAFLRPTELSSMPSTEESASSHPSVHKPLEAAHDLPPISCEFPSPWTRSSEQPLMEHTALLSSRSSGVDMLSVPTSFSSRRPRTSFNSTRFDEIGAFGLESDNKTAIFPFTDDLISPSCSPLPPDGLDSQQSRLPLYLPGLRTQPELTAREAEELLRTVQVGAGTTERQPLLPHTDSAAAPTACATGHVVQAGDTVNENEHCNDSSELLDYTLKAATNQRDAHHTETKSQNQGQSHDAGETFDGAAVPMHAHENLPLQRTTHKEITADSSAAPNKPPTQELLSELIPELRESAAAVEACRWSLSRAASDTELAVQARVLSTPKLTQSNSDSSLTVRSTRPVLGVESVSSLISPGSPQEPMPSLLQTLGSEQELEPPVLLSAVASAAAATGLKTPLPHCPAVWAFHKLRYGVDSDDDSDFGMEAEEATSALSNGAVGLYLSEDVNDAAVSEAQRTDSAALALIDQSLLPSLSLSPSPSPSPSPSTESSTDRDVELSSDNENDEDSEDIYSSATEIKGDGEVGEDAQRQQPVVVKEDVEMKQTCEESAQAESSQSMASSSTHQPQHKSLLDGGVETRRVGESKDCAIDGDHSIKVRAAAGEEGDHELGITASYSSSHGADSPYSRADSAAELLAPGKTTSDDREEWKDAMEGPGEGDTQQSDRVLEPSTSAFLCPANIHSFEECSHHVAQVGQEGVEEGEGNDVDSGGGSGGGSGGIDPLELHDAASLPICQPPTTPLPTESPSLPPIPQAAIGVRMACGMEIHAPVVVCAAGARNLYSHLLPPEALKRANLDEKAITSVPQSHGHMTAFVTLEGTPLDCGIFSAQNLHTVPSSELFDRCQHDISRLQEAYYQDPVRHIHDALITITCPTLKDPLSTCNRPTAGRALGKNEGEYAEAESSPDAHTHRRQPGGTQRDSDRDSRSGDRSHPNPEPDPVPPERTAVIMLAEGLWDWVEPWAHDHGYNGHLHAVGDEQHTTYEGTSGAIDDEQQFSEDSRPHTHEHNLHANSRLHTWPRPAVLAGSTGCGAVGDESQRRGQLNTAAPGEEIDLETTHGHRSLQYKEYKLQFRDAFLQRLYRYFPRTRGRVLSVRIGSPLTTAHFLHAPHGGSYGQEWSLGHFDRNLQDTYLHPVTAIEGLYMAGEGSFVGGILGALISGWVTAWHIVGWTGILRIFLCVEPRSDPRNGTMLRSLAVATWRAVCWLFRMDVDKPLW